MRFPCSRPPSLAAPVLAACTQNATTDDRRPATTRTITVSSTDDACDALGHRGARPARSPSTSPTTARRSPSSTCYAEDGQRIVGEVENIGPGLTRAARRQRAAPAPTSTACKPGMKGDGIRADFTVTDSGAEGQRLGRRRSSWSTQAAGRATAPTSRTSPTSCSTQDRRVRRRRTRPATTHAPGRSTRGAHPLGADRDRRGVLRRPRPEDGRPRGRPRARARSGPAGTASRRTCGRPAPETTRR